MSLPNQKKSVDPLYQLFEHHLLTRSYEDATAFTKEVAEKYLQYLDSTEVHVPVHARASVVEDLEQEAHEMLIKKMYGVIQPNEYWNFGKVVKVQHTKRHRSLSTFDFHQSQAPEEENKKR